MNEAIRALLPDEATAARFWWVRHARVPEIGHQMYGSLDVDCDTDDEPLFQAIAARLPRDAVWVTSQLRRTRQTADALVAAGAGPAPVMSEDPRIAEMNFGDLNGRLHVELIAERSDPFIAYFPLSPHETAPAGESFETLTTRVSDFMKHMHAEHPGRDIICVAHRGTIMAALRHALQMPLQTSVAFAIDNVSITQMTRYANVPADGPMFRVSEVGWLPTRGGVSGA